MRRRWGAGQDNSTKKRRASGFLSRSDRRAATYRRCVPIELFPGVSSRIASGLQPPCSPSHHRSTGLPRSCGMPRPARTRKGTPARTPRRRKNRAGRRGERMRSLARLLCEGVSSNDRAAAASLAHRAARRTGEGMDAQSEPAAEHDRGCMRLRRPESFLADLHAIDGRQPSPVARGQYLIRTLFVDATNFNTCRRHV